MSIKDKQNHIVETFAILPDMEEKFRWVMEAGDKYPQIDSRHRVAGNLLPGCISQLWLHPELRDGRCHFEMDADAKISKGIAAVVCGVFEGETPADVAAADMSFLDEAGLAQMLSSNRSNGLASLSRRIHEFAQAESAEA
jgi:cysteine desulfuration protein SufE